MHREYNYQRKYQKYKRKYLELSTGGDGLRMNNLDLCKQCHTNDELVKNCENYAPCFTIDKDGMIYKLWSKAVYGRTYYGWSNSGGVPGKVIKGLKRKLNTNSTGIISKFKEGYLALLTEDDKKDVNIKYPDLLNKFDTFIRNNKQFRYYVRR